MKHALRMFADLDKFEFAIVINCGFGFELIYMDVVFSVLPVCCNPPDPACGGGQDRNPNK